MHVTEQKVTVLEIQAKSRTGHITVNTVQQRIKENRFANVRVVYCFINQILKLGRIKLDSNDFL